jgi:small-conductance mechanosensitive channel
MRPPAASLLKPFSYDPWQEEQSMEKLIEIVLDLLPMTVVIVIGIGLLGFLNRRMALKSKELAGEGTFRRQIVLTFLAILFVVAVIVTAPLAETMQGNLISLFGIAVTAVIALSSTTLASNAMAGLMLRAVRNFKRGDYIRCGDFLGRVTERGLFHTEIQNERSDLITLPNLHLATNPVTVIRPSGTFVSARLSLGYDLQHDEIEKLLIEAAEHAGLVEAFVRIRSLGDFSVTYEISGQLVDTKKFLGSKSALHRAVLDTLHGAGVEIVSPTFMNQRQIKEGHAFVPEVEAPAEPTRDRSPDSLVFDKADQVEKVEDLRLRLTALDNEIAELEAKAKASEGPEAGKIKETIFLRQRIRERLVERIADLEEKVSE